jgi:hypothetical protein
MYYMLDIQTEIFHWAMYVVLTGLSIYQLSWNPMGRQLRIIYVILLSVLYDQISHLRPKKRM